MSSQQNACEGFILLIHLREIYQIWNLCKIAQVSYFIHFTRLYILQFSKNGQVLIKHQENHKQQHFPVNSPYISKNIITKGALLKVSKGAKIRNRYNQVPHLTQDTNGKVTNSQLDTTNESQEVSPFPKGDRKAHINRRAQRHSKHKTEKKHKRSTKEEPPWDGQ